MSYSAKPFNTHLQPLIETQPVYTKNNPTSYINSLGELYTWDFTVYRTLISQDVTYTDIRGDFHEDTVRIEAFGLEMTTTKKIGAKVFTEHLDRGLLTAQLAEINYLVNQLVKAPLDSQTSMEVIDGLIERELAAWARNKWKSAFGQAAERKLKKQIEAQRGYHKPINKLTETRPPRKDNVFNLIKEALKNHNKNNGRGVDL